MRRTVSDLEQGGTTAWGNVPAAATEHPPPARSFGGENLATLACGPFLLARQSIRANYLANVILHSTVLVADGTTRTVAVSF